MTKLRRLWSIFALSFAFPYKLSFYILSSLLEDDLGSSHIQELWHKNYKSTINLHCRLCFRICSLCIKLTPSRELGSLIFSDKISTLCTFRRKEKSYRSLKSIFASSFAFVYIELPLGCTRRKLHFWAMAFGQSDVKLPLVASFSLLYRKSKKKIGLRRWFLCPFSDFWRTNCEGVCYPYIEMQDTWNSGSTCTKDFWWVFIGDIVLVARLEDFRDLKSSNPMARLEDLRNLKSSKLEYFRALEILKLTLFWVIKTYPSIFF